ncbi:FAD-binding protein [Eggerthella sinensis]|uniref:FAD-binding dehydrogenase n=1 Tax=Eggerthella sinensis TaxID=242230 RepID=A0A3N0J0Z1_9ACTN|nr:FAD-binding protein [Eggerthella sinensis]RDB71837.1 FAD-binding dehydrogenase [Eggerthella sinensis]RNM42864.1 FAD-binding dehydrogenase [Eggerthella sinensis]
MNNAQSGLSRRSFLKGAGITALGAAAAGALAGCGNGYVNAAEAKNVATQMPGTPSWLGAAPDVAETDITETIDVDVVVVGCRTGGLPAVISAAEHGAKVLGIEQMSAIATPREDLGAIDSTLQRESFEEFPQFEIDKMEAMEDIVRYANGFVNYDLVKLWADESGDMIDWLSEIIARNGEFAMRFEGSVGTEGQGARDKAWATGHSPEKLTDNKDVTFGTTLRDYAEELGAEFRYDTMLVKCEQDASGRVTGVICRDGNDRHYLRVNASKGVILATGGYAANTEMVEARQAWNNRLKINVPVGGSCTGDGIKAALWCGATIDPIGAAVTFNRACCKPDEVAGSDLVGKWFWFGEQPFLKVNLNGKRFCNESGPYDYMLHSAFMQPYHTYVDIWDSDYVEQVRQINEVGCCRLYPFDNGAPSNMPITKMASDFEALIEAGYIQQADTMEELAEKLNLPVDATVETWERYNGFAEAGKDDDYNKEPYRLTQLTHPPYYGVRTGAWFLATIDGVLIDTDMHAVDEAGKAIDGLYMVGNDSGGFFSVSYPNLFTGLAAGRTMTFGRRAGMLAATGQA